MKRTLLFILAAFITAIAFFYAWTDWQGARQLKAALSTLEEKHESIRLEDFIPPAIPDERNVAAAPIFKEYFACIAQRNSAKKIPAQSSLDKLLKSFEFWKNFTLKKQADGSFLHFRAKQLNSNFSGDETAAATLILKTLEPFTPILEELRTAFIRPNVLWPLNYSTPLYAILIPQITACFNIDKILQTRAMAELVTGSPEKAFEDTQTLLAVAKAVKEPPFLIDELVELACLGRAASVINTALESHAWNETQLAMLSQELAKPKLLQQYADALRMERICALQFDFSSPKFYLDHWNDGEKTTTPLPQKGLKGFWDKTCNFSKEASLRMPLQLILFLRPAGWLTEDKARYLITIQNCIDKLSHAGFLSPTDDFWEKFYSQKEPEDSLWNLYKNPYELSLSPPAIKKFCFTQTILNSLQASCAVERYRMARHHLPITLDELIPTFLPAVPKDPMTGEPLHYKPSSNNSFVIYGLGWNRKDEGGPKVSLFHKSPQNQANWGIMVKPHQ